MGNYRFRLSNMMPNSWFYKLRDNMAKSTKPQTKRIPNHPSSSNQSPQQKQAFIPNRASYYFPSSNSPSHPKALDTHFPIDPPRKSIKKSPRKATKPFSSASSSSASNLIIEFDDDSLFSTRRLPPIQTKPARRKEAAKAEALDSKHIMLKRAQQGPHRIKVRPSSPKVEIKRVRAKRGSAQRIMVSNSKRIGESLVVVKKSSNPKSDFRESMVEMIMENDIKASKDLEELLACYLSLNSVEYHDLIVQVFEEIWVGLKEGERGLL